MALSWLPRSRLTAPGSASFQHASTTSVSKPLPPTIRRQVRCECTKRAQQPGLGIGVQQQQQQRGTNSSSGSCHSRQRCAHHAPRSTKSPLKTNALVGEGLPTISSLQAIQAGRQAGSKFKEQCKAGHVPFLLPAYAAASLQPTSRQQAVPGAPCPLSHSADVVELSVCVAHHVDPPAFSRRRRHLLGGGAGGTCRSVFGCDDKRDARST